MAACGQVASESPSTNTAPSPSAPSPEKPPAAADAAVASCETYVAQASPAELRATPRTNLDAELLALETSPTSLVAPQPLYERIAADLTLIIGTDATLSTIHVASSIGTEGLLLNFDAATFRAVVEGTYHGWDCPNAAYGATLKANLTSSDLAVLAFDPHRLNVPLLVTEYERLPGVKSASLDYLVGDGPDLCLERRGDRHFYIFDAASGDCPAGCTEHAYTAFQVDPGNVTKLGVYDPATTATPPAWWPDLKACRDDL